jgi:acyltransferase
MDVPMNNQKTLHNRIKSIDVARFYGIVLVYYGHIVEQVMYTGSAEAAAQYKFIYSFHMPLFFLLAGTVVADKKLSLPFSQFFKRTLASRLVPYVFFSILMAIASLFISGWFPLGALTDSGAYLKSFVATLIGFPAFCIPLWFMVLLIGVELFHALISQVIQRTSVLILTAVFLYVGGYYLNDGYNFVANQHALWFINEIPVVYVFYVAGILLKKSGVLTRKFPRLWTLLGAAICLSMVALTFDLNNGPFRHIQAVVIVLSGHGNIVLFPMTAFIGSLFILFAAAGSPAWGWLSYLGKNALSLFCLNGLFYHFVNPLTAKWFSEAFSISHANIFMYSTAMTVISLMVCWPFVVLLTTYVPQLIGKPMVNGPLFRPLMRY